jgi:hypothetical protein
VLEVTKGVVKFGVHATKQETIQTMQSVPKQLGLQLKSSHSEMMRMMTSESSSTRSIRRNNKRALKSTY